jgi:ParB family chromosome partitioning protein
MSRRRAFDSLSFKNKTLKEVKKEVESIIKDVDSNEIKYIDIDLINPPEFHDRKLYSQEKIDDLAKSIKEIGLIEPIIVRDINGKYERIAGFRRLEAFKKLYQETKDEKWKSIPAIILNTDDKSAIKIMLSENIFREDLNEYDKSLSIVEYISRTLDISPKKIASIVYKSMSNVANLTKEEEETLDKIEQLLKELGYTIRSFKDRLRVINSNKIIIKALQEGKINISVALELERIVNDHPVKTEELIERYSKGEISTRQLKEEVRKILGKTSNEIKEIEETLFKLKKKFKKLPDKRKKEIRELIQKLKELL